jgi:hypothetical protein
MFSMRLRQVLWVLLCCGGLYAAEEAAPELVIYNRILAKVHGKTLSVIDVMKKMDLFLQKQYPDAVGSSVARYQFYASHWQETLQQMVDTELMLADAERLEVKVSDAEVREEILRRFGPNIMPALDALSLPYEEARTLIHDELVVQKMNWFRVSAKVLSRITSRDVCSAYAHYIQEHPATNECCYEVLSIRAPAMATGEAVADKACALLQQHLPLQDITQQLQGESVSVTLSTELRSEERNLSEAHREALRTLAPGAYSLPIAQVSRSDQSTVFRIFHLKERIEKPVPPFARLADALREDLLQQEAQKEHTLYLKRLRQQMGYDKQQMLETLPAQFQPFALRS